MLEVQPMAATKSARNLYYGACVRRQLAVAQQAPLLRAEGRKTMARGRDDDICNNIDDETIELHAMGRLQDGPIRQHLDACEFCRARVAKYRSWIEGLKQAIKELREEEAQPPSPPKNGSDPTSSS